MKRFYQSDKSCANGLALAQPVLGKSVCHPTSSLGNPDIARAQTQATPIDHRKTKDSIHLKSFCCLRSYCDIGTMQYTSASQFNCLIHSQTSQQTDQLTNSHIISLSASEISNMRREPKIAQIITLSLNHFSSTKSDFFGLFFFFWAAAPTGDEVL